MREATRSTNRIGAALRLTAGVLVVIAGLALLTGPAAATTPNFGPPTEVTGSGGGAGHFLGVSCTDATDCTAVGYDNNSQPIYATETDGTWGTATVVTGSGGGAGYFYGVSCTDASDCTAVGTDGNNQPIYATESGGTWGTATEVTGSGGGGGVFQSVSCTDASDCTAVGNDENAQPIYATAPAPSASATAASVTGSTVLGDGTVSDTLTVKGTSGGPTPTNVAGGVDFYACHVSDSGTLDPQLCPTANGTLYDDSEILSGSNGTATATSSSFTPTATGTWCFSATYSGDDNYSGSSDNVTGTTNPNECVLITAATSATSTTPTVSSITLGQSNTDAAVVTGNAAGGSPTGTVSFYECGPTASAQACTSMGNPVGSAVSLTAGAGNTSSSTSVSFTPTGTGYWCFAGYYSGDSNYSASSDTSTVECFDVTAAKPTITKFSPVKGDAGKKVTIRGTNLSGASSVKFNGVKAVIITDTATEITTKVPSHAKTGFITVTTAGGTARSATKYKVT
jgi:hypothetical protein